MNEYELKLSNFINSTNVQAQLLVFQTSCHSVAEAAASANASADDFVKNICTIDESGNLVVSIIPGVSKLDLKKVSAIVGSKVRFARPDEILAKTGYPAGGTPSFGYSALFLIDPLVLQKEIVYSGGGSQTALTRVAPKEILRINSAGIWDVVKS
ncbi:YbaK/EbsC family protein [Candidatus Micrarchaeota archaeon]|nr:YbaK/EbsC family protein [Candidatus Micrarchaeota archaeon]